MGGSISLRARFLIAAACAVPVLRAWVGMTSIWGLREDWIRNVRDPFWFSNGLALFVIATLLATFAPPWRLSRFVRVAVLLPAVHAACVLLVWHAYLGIRA